MSEGKRSGRARANGRTQGETVTKEEWRRAHTHGYARLFERKTQRIA